MITDSPDANAAKITSEYAELHKADWIPTNYDENIYNPAGYDSWVWQLYRPYLTGIVQDLASRRPRMKYLDFACGTGRIIAALEPLATESVGLDISPQMIEYAQRKVSRSTLYCANILEDSEEVGSQYDLITAFRFFLNTEPEMKRLVMRSLAARLADRDSRLIFNIHMNKWSADRLTSVYQRVRGRGSVNTMSYPQVRRLVEDAGLEIESWRGFGLWPHRLYRSPVGFICKWLDRFAVRLRPLRWISHDIMFVCRHRFEAQRNPYGTATQAEPQGR